MKSLTKASFKKWILLAVISIFIISSCQKQIDQPAKHEETEANDNIHGHLKQTNTYSSDVVLKWMDMQLQLMRTNYHYSCEKGRELGRKIRKNIDQKLIFLKQRHD